MFNPSNEKFSKGVGLGLVLKFVTPDGSLRKNAKKFLLFLQKQLNFKTCLVKFWFDGSVLSSAKRAQNKHKKNWREQAKLLDVLF